MRESKLRFVSSAEFLDFAQARPEIYRAMTIMLARPKGITCDSITVGRLTIAFSAAAHVRVGTARTAVVTHGAATYRARISS